MLTEPVECSSCNAVSVNGGTIHCHTCFEQAVRIGFMYALDQYGIWKDGTPTLGAMETPIKTILKEFDEEGTASLLANSFRKL